ncbi:MAG: hypothetical protein PHT36_00410 [Patescibacteria group bacterium]|nr:hypothetical protein [Patescibacteria group bacterium]
MIIKSKKGSAWVGILILLVFIISLGLALVVDSLGTIIQAKRSAKIQIAQALCDAGIERAIWRLNNGEVYIGEDNLKLPTGSIDISVTGDFNSKEILVTSHVPNKEDPKKNTRSVRAKLVAERNEGNFAFHYGIQVGETGLIMSNNSKVVGNVYSGGSIEGGNGAYIMGDVFISGSGNRINNVRVGCPSTMSSPCPSGGIAGSAHVHTILSSYIYGDAYYSTNANLVSSTVLGTKYENSPLPKPLDLAIPDLSIDTWKSWAEAGGTYSGNYTLSANGSTVNLGPYKIDGNLTITNGATLNLTGVIWVTGRVTFSQNAIVKLSSSYGPKSGMIISDGQMYTENNVVMNGSGDPASFIMMLSTSSADPAIDIANNSSSVVYYAGNGFIDVANNAHIRSISGKGIRLKNGAIVEYDMGLANSNFSAGPGGSWKIKEWQVVYN